MMQPDDLRFLTEAATELRRRTYDVSEPYDDPKTGEPMIDVDDEPKTIPQMRELMHDLLRENTAMFVHPRDTINE